MMMVIIKAALLLLCTSSDIVIVATAIQRVGQCTIVNLTDGCIDPPFAGAEPYVFELLLR
jgi:hypothetical protein